MMRFLQSVQPERRGVAAACVVFIVCAIVSVLVWGPLSWVVRKTEWLIPIGGCRGIREFTPSMFACAFAIGILSVARVVLIMGVLYWILSLPIRRGAGVLARRLPADAQFLLAPLFATVLFVVPWAGAHTAANVTGLVPQKWFPAFVGLFTFVAAQYGSDLQARLGDFFDRRERYAWPVRLIIAAAAALVLSIFLGYASTNFAWREQVILLFCLVAFGLAVMPRTGDLLTSIQRKRS